MSDYTVILIFNIDLVAFYIRDNMVGIKARSLLGPNYKILRSDEIRWDRSAVLSHQNHAIGSDRIIAANDSRNDTNDP